jgi:hypothetical protein
VQSSWTKENVISKAINKGILRIYVQKVNSQGISFIREPDKTGTHVDHLLHYGWQNTWNAYIEGKASRG